MFDKLNALMDMRKKMQQVKEELENTWFEIRGQRGLVTIAMSGTQKIRDIRFDADLKDLEKEALSDELADAFNRAIKRSQEVAAQKMKDVTGLNLPGM